MNYNIRPVAREDIFQQYRYYLIEKDSEIVAQRFLVAVQRATEELCLHPEMGSRKALANPMLKDCEPGESRAFLLCGFTTCTGRARCMS